MKVLLKFLPLLWSFLLTPEGSVTLFMFCLQAWGRPWHIPCGYRDSFVCLFVHHPHLISSLDVSSTLLTASMQTLQRALGSFLPLRSRKSSAGNAGSCKSRFFQRLKENGGWCWWKNECSGFGGRLFFVFLFWLVFRWILCDIEQQRHHGWQLLALETSLIVFFFVFVFHGHRKDFIPNINPTNCWP